MYYDFHIHSSLSPCADDDMTPNNIVNMSLIKGLDVIAITDHNSILQLPSFEIVARNKLKLLYGIEVQTIEEVHIVCLFKNISGINSFYNNIKKYKNFIKNDINYFGHQLIINEFDEVIGEEDCLLLNSIDLCIEDICNIAKNNNGAVVLAHVMDKANGLITQLGFIPCDLKFDAIEIKNDKQKEELLKRHPNLNTIWLYNSDAHHLVDINECVHTITDDEYEKLWRNSL